MVNRVDKQLKKLNPKQQDAFTTLLEKIITGNLQGLDLLKLKGSKDIFRVRKGDYRIIFKKGEEGTVNIIAFEHRSESTYRYF